MVSHELIQQLKSILREDYSLELTDEVVAELASSLVSLFVLLSEIHNS